jgi:hypothetical protein
VFGLAAGPFFTVVDLSSAAGQHDVRRVPRSPTLSTVMQVAAVSLMALGTRAYWLRRAALSALRIAAGRLDHGDVLGFCLGGDSGVDHLLPCLLSDLERSLLSGSELVCIDVGGDALGEGDPGGIGH